MLLSGCAESVAFLGSSLGGASTGKIFQSSVNSAISYGVKHKTGKTPLGHVLAYAEEKNPEKKKDTCFSSIESTRSEFCTIAKKQISLTSTDIKEKTKKIKNIILEKENDLVSGFFKSKKSARDLAIAFQSKLKRRWFTAPIQKLRP